MTAQPAAPVPSRLTRILTGHTGEVAAVAFSPDGRRLATGVSVRTLTGHTGRVYGVAFSSDGTLLATADLDEAARLWA